MSFYCVKFKLINSETIGHGFTAPSESIIGGFRR